MIWLENECKIYSRFIIIVYKMGNKCEYIPIRYNIIYLLHYISIIYKYYSWFIDMEAK